MSELVFLYIAYTLLWLGLFLYLGYLHLQQSKLEKEIEILNNTVKSYGKENS